MYSRAAVHIWEESQKDLMEEKLVKTCIKSFSCHYNQALGSLPFDPHKTNKQTNKQTNNNKNKQTTTTKTNKQQKKKKQNVYYLQKKNIIILSCLL